ncbi:MAG: uroporphyrinogen decarboxylase family protein [Eubacteriales bacterium]
MKYFHVMEQYRERIAESRAQLLATWQGKNTRPAVIFSDVNYALCGQTDIPADYFDPAVMLEYQMKKIIQHMETIPDDYVPVLHPWYGTTVLPSALGVEVHYPEGMDPALGAAILEKPEQVYDLKMPDFETDGQCPQVLACIDYMKAHTDVPICVTDTQGPLNLALSLAGAVNLFLWFYMAPDAVHHLMGFCTDLLIAWVTAQKQRAGHQIQGDAYPHAIEMPAQFGGIAFSEDDIVVISMEQYETFVAPYHERLFQVFGGGSVHFCGSGLHQVASLGALQNIGAVNNFSMGNFEQIKALQKAMEGRGTVMACDFNGSDIPWHCESLAQLAKTPKGLILGVFFAPTMALLPDGKYTDSDRSTAQVVGEYLAQFQEKGLLPKDH